MSGHSKWHSIKHKKGAADAKRGKIFTKHAKLITIAARNGSDPGMNPALRSAIVNAKSDNVPNANIDKAVKKGSGEGKDATVYEEFLYEGFGLEGTALLVEVLTDNKNRSVTNVKTTITKSGGRMGESGSVGYMFNRRGVILAKFEGDPEEGELAAIDSGAIDVVPGEIFEIHTEANELMKVRDALEGSGFTIEKAELMYLAKEDIVINDASKAEKVLKLIDALEDDEDVSNVYSNFDIPEEILESMG